MTIYLYVKKHNITGLKYFGMTKKSNPFKYLGSGKYWKRHIKDHGIQHVQTLDIWGFDDQLLCTEFAIKFSTENEIVESDQWANLLIETGHNNNVGYLNHSAKKKISKAISKLKWFNDGTKNIRAEIQPLNTIPGRLKFKRISPTLETRNKMSRSNIGKAPGNKGIPLSESQKLILSNYRIDKVNAYCLLTNHYIVVSREEFDTNNHYVGNTSKLIPCRD